MRTPLSSEKTLETMNILALAAIVLGLVVPWTPWFWLAGALLVIGAFLRPVARMIAAAWMQFAHVLGTINTRILLMLTFYAVLTPLAVAYRVLHGDFLHLRGGKVATSLWLKRDHRYTPKDLETMW